jgi:hypothetical protein
MEQEYEKISKSCTPPFPSPFYASSSNLGLVTKSNISYLAQSDPSINSTEKIYGTNEPAIAYWQSELLTDFGDFGRSLLFEQITEKSTQGESSTTHGILGERNNTPSQKQHIP